MDWRATTALAFIGMLLLPGAACTERSASRGTSLVVSLVGDAITLDPAAISDSESMQVVVQIFDTLVRYENEGSEPRPALAVKWHHSADGTTWTFHLRSGVRFHDGTPFDADAVILSFERQRDAGHPFHFQAFTYWESMFRNIQEVKKVDRYTVRIRIARRYSPFLANLTMFPMSIVSPSAMRSRGRGFASGPVGTGPFRFVRWVKGHRIYLESNRDYWGERPPSVDNLIFEVVADPRSRLLKLQSNAVDVAHGLPPSDRQIVALHPDLRLHRTPGNTVAYLAMNTQRPPFNDVRIRRAVNFAVDRDAIVKLAFQGQAVRADSPLPPGVWSHVPKFTRYPFDPQRARQLLREAGYVGTRRPRFFVMSTPRPYLPSPVLVGRMIARYLAQIEMEVDLVVRPFSEHLKATQVAEHDLCLAGWTGDILDPDHFLYMLLDRDNARKGASRNLAMFTNEKVHDLLALAREKHDRPERERLYVQAQEIIAEEAPWVPLAHTDIILAARRTVTNLQVLPSTAILFQAVGKGGEGLEH